MLPYRASRALSARNIGIALGGLFALILILNSHLEALPHATGDIHMQHMADGQNRESGHAARDAKVADAGEAQAHHTHHKAQRKHDKKQHASDDDEGAERHAAERKHGKRDGGARESGGGEAGRNSSASMSFGDKGHVTLTHYGHGIFHVQHTRAEGHEAGRDRCRHTETVIAGVPAALDHAKTAEGRLEVQGGGVHVVAEVVKDAVHVTMGGRIAVTLHADTASVVQHEVRAATGLPERTSGLVLQDGSYELWNLDVQYTLDNKNSLYGIVPIIVGLGKSEDASSGVLWLNPAHTRVQVTNDGDEGTVTSEWVAKRGCSQFALYPGGASTLDVLRQHAHFTGKPFFPPLFSLGYHQCRWSYKTQEDVLGVSKRLQEENMPCDSIWLDIDHADRKHYFTWDPRNFPDPVAMQDELEQRGRHLVAITDPHISTSKGYRVHDEAEAKGFFVKTERGDRSFKGHCWPGESSWVDFLNPAARDWYSGQFELEVYKGSTSRLFTWIDMNEPSVFSGPRLTMPDNAKHHDGTPHVEVHNIYGHLQCLAAHNGLQRRSGGKERGFVLSRSFFAGSQRYAAIWTGDNKARWEYLSASIHMLLSMSMGGIPFVGADVGGFFPQYGERNPKTEHDLMARWWQTGALYPFFRGHAHEASMRKEPYVVDEPYKTAIRRALHLRYELIPYLYTTFWNATSEGVPIWRPLFLMFPDERPTRVSAFMVGDHLLSAPVTGKVTEMPLDFPGASPTVWYDYFDHSAHAAGSTSHLAVDVNTIPLYQRSGSVVVTREMRDNITSTEGLSETGYRLRIAVDERGNASGTVYLDDEHSNDYQKGHYNFKKVQLVDGVLNVVCGHGDVTSPYSTMPPSDVPYTPPPGRVTSVLLLGWQGDLAVPSQKLSDTVHLVTGLNYQLAGEWTMRLREPHAI